MDTVLPSAMWLPFGARLLRARSDKGLSRAELARTVGVTDDKLRQVEYAYCRPARTLVERVDTALGTDRQLLDAWAITLQAEAFPNEFGDLREIGLHAARLWEHQPMAVPTFLRTREYSRAILGPAHPGLDTEQVESLVDEEMLHRAAMIGPEGPELRVVVNEPVLTRPQGGAAVSADQRGFLADLIEAGIVTMAVIPEETPHHPGLGGAFRLMEFEDRPSMVYAFAARDGDLTADPEQVGRCAMIREAIEDAAVELTPDSRLLTAGRPGA
ncbi:helix-turn-helix transcriptional regulator [Nocardiopsis sp. CNT312]|uniref:helix-turn-helix domain-containing protein n=1 Tax=Nocardiopsis sp. CNT312 TaxID=1137268 RepID=UPI00048EAD63|nr:helix-turn-helix transcriptional regulator [Nocardiopsis sp. CNT312]